MRCLDDRIEVTWEFFPSTFLIEEVNEFLELILLDEDEGAFSGFAKDDLSLVVILGILQVTDCLKDNLSDDERYFFHAC